MHSGKINIVTDGMWGSCGKGAIATALTYHHKPELISTTSMANAGHTAVYHDGQSFIAKALPSPAALERWTEHQYSPTIVIGATAAFHLPQLLKEVEHCQTSKLLIHPRAGVITPEHQEAERDGSNSTKHIASTMQGCGTFLSDKILRKPGLKLAGDYEELQQYTSQFLHENMAVYLNEQCIKGKMIIHEGSQGFSLDINHGSNYPHCTSRGTTAIQNLADLGISPRYLGDIYLVIRPFPIRVGNVVENGNTVGYSGGCYPDQKEITWAEVAAFAGMPPEVADSLLRTELTTVTKRLRRVFSFSMRQIKESALINGATKIALNFANYVDYSVSGVNEYRKLSDKVKSFIADIEDAVNLPVTVVGTGPKVTDVVLI